MRKRWLTALRSAARFGTMAAGVVLAACVLPGGPSADPYELRSVNGRSLPADYPDPLMPPGVFQVTGGRLDLDDDGTFSGSFALGCDPDQELGNTCTVAGDGENEFEGTYSREEGWMELGGRRYPAEFGNGSVSLRIFIPAYQGYYPQFDLRFTR